MLSWVCCLGLATNPILYQSLSRKKHLFHSLWHDYLLAFTSRLLHLWGALKGVDNICPPGAQNSLIIRC
jgi:hypothetical protein